GFATHSPEVARMRCAWPECVAPGSNGLRPRRRQDGRQIVLVPLFPEEWRDAQCLLLLSQARQVLAQQLAEDLVDPRRVVLAHDGAEGRLGVAALGVVLQVLLAVALEVVERLLEQAPDAPGGVGLEGDVRLAPAGGDPLEVLVGGARPAGAHLADL